MSFRIKIALVFSIAIVAAVGYFKFYWMPRTDRISEQALSAGVRSHLASVANGLVAPLLQNQLASIHEHLDALLRDNPDWLAVVLYDRAGQRLYPFSKPKDLSGASIHTFKRDIYSHDELLGNISVTVDFRPGTALMGRIHARLALSLGGGFSVIVLVLFLLVDTMVRRPTRQLAVAANRLAHGDFEATLPKVRRDEIGVLISSFATMRDQIKSDKEALSRARDELEARVERRTAELHAINAELSESEGRFSAVFDNSPAAVSLSDADGRFSLVNRRFQEWFGLEQEDVLGKTPAEVFPSALAAASLEYDRKTLQTGKPAEFEREIEISSGKRCTAVISKFPVLDKDERCMGIGTLITDVTEERQTQAMLRQAHKMDAVGQLTGGVAHDFNNLLTAIIGALQLLDEAVGDDPAVKARLKTALRAAFRGADLTKHLLAFSRSEALAPVLLDLNETIPALVELLKRTLGADIEIETILAEGLWAAMIDAALLENALLNLAVNARDAMPKGGKLTIETANVRFDETYAKAGGEMRPGHYVMISVSDTGCGMSQDILEKVFDPFFTTKEVGKGTGLGLSMVYGFVAQSGGHIDVESDEGRGTVIRIYFPRSVAALQRHGAEESAASDPPGGSETILVVEDDGDVRDFVTAVLNGLGYAVLEAEDGPSALCLLQNGASVDVLLTDVVMPGGMSGRDVAAEARKRVPGIKVLFTSGYTRDAIARDGGLDDGVELIAKPYGKEALARKVRSVLDR